MIFLENPAKRRRKRSTAKRATKRRKKRSPPKGFRSWKAYMASIRPGAKKARKRRKRRKTTTAAAPATRRRVRRRRSTATAASGKGPVMARRRRRSAAPRKRSRRRYHRNPSIVGTLKRGVMEGVGVVAGGTVLRMVNNKLPLPQTGPVSVAVKLGLAAALGTFAARFVPSAIRSTFVAGAFGAAIEDSVNAMGLHIPGLSAYPSLSAYPRAGSLSGYPSGASGADMSDALGALPLPAPSVTTLPPFSHRSPMAVVQQYD